MSRNNESSIDVRKMAKELERQQKKLEVSNKSAKALEIQRKEHKIAEIKEYQATAMTLNDKIAKLPLPQSRREEYKNLTSPLSGAVRLQDEGLMTQDKNRLRLNLIESLKGYGKLLAEDIENERYKKDRTITKYLQDFSTWVGASRKLVGAYTTKRNNPDKYKEAIQIRNEASKKALMYSPKREKSLESQGLEVITSLTKMSEVQFTDSSNQRDVTPVGGVALPSLTKPRGNQSSNNSRRR